MFPFAKLTFGGLFSCAPVSNTQTALHPNLQGSSGFFHTTVDQNPSYKLKVNELVDLTTSGIVSRYTWYKPYNLWSSLQCLGTHECVCEPLASSVNSAVSNMKRPDMSDDRLWNMSGAHGIRVTAEIELPHYDSDLGLGFRK